MLQRKIRVGLVGASHQNQWGGRVHAAVFQGLPETELIAVCTAHPETAEASAKQFGVSYAFSDYRKMVNLDEIDLVSVSVRVDMHHPIVLAALEAGKHVICEWPLAVTSEQARELCDQATTANMYHAVVLQSRCSPAIMYIRDLVAQGFIGDPRVLNITFFQSNALTGRRAQKGYLRTKEGGGSALSIAGGHAMDMMCWCFGELHSLCADVDTMLKEDTLPDTNEQVPVTSIDNVALVGRLRNGAMATVQVSWTTDPGQGWRLHAFGSEGSLIASTDGMVQYSPITLTGFRRGELTLRELTIPSEYNWTPEFLPSTQQFNVAQLIRRLARAISAREENVRPNFHDGVRLHKLLEDIERSALARKWVEVATVPSMD